MKLLHSLDSREPAPSKERSTNHNLNVANSVTGHFQDPETAIKNNKDGEMIDVEGQFSANASKSVTRKSVYQGLGWLDRLLALWILLAIIIGILLGNFVESVGPALQRGKFVNVSVPIGI